MSKRINKNNQNDVLLKRNLLKSKKRNRCRTAMFAPHIKSQLYHWTNDNGFSDKDLERFVNGFINSKYYNDPTFKDLKRVIKGYYLGTSNPKHKWISKKQVFNKRSSNGLFKAISYHIIARILIFYSKVSIQTQYIQQKNKPKNELKLKLPVMPHIAMILHDKDYSIEPNSREKLVSPHVQTSVHFSKPVSLDSLAKWIGIATHDVQKGGQNKYAEENAMAYLTHIKQPFSDKITRSHNTVKVDGTAHLKKYHYDYHDVIYDAPFFDYRALRKRCLHNWLAYRGEQIRDYCQMSVAELKQKLIQKHVTMDDIYRNKILFQIYCSQKNFDINKINKALKDKASYIHLANFKKDWENGRMHRTVIYLCGESRAGKSYMAKRAGALVRLEHNRKHKNDKWRYKKLSGTNGTLFQNYDDQDLITLDDVRSDNLGFHEFLSVADDIPQRKMYGTSRIIARAVMITNPCFPAKFFSEISGNKDENKTQALGRLDLVIEAVKVHDKHGNVVMTTDKNGKLKPKRMARVYHICQKAKAHRYNVKINGHNESFYSNMVLYPNPHLNYRLGSYSLVTPETASKIMAHKILKDNDPKINHKGNDRPVISERDYTKPTCAEQNLIDKDCYKHKPEARGIKVMLEKYSIKHSPKLSDTEKIRDLSYIDDRLCNKWIINGKTEIVKNNPKVNHEYKEVYGQCVKNEYTTSTGMNVYKVYKVHDPFLVNEDPVKHLKQELHYLIKPNDKLPF